MFSNGRPNKTGSSSSASQQVASILNCRFFPPYTRSYTATALRSHSITQQPPRSSVLDEKLTVAQLIKKFVDEISADVICTAADAWIYAKKFVSWWEPTSLLTCLPEATTGLYLNQITSGKPELDTDESFRMIIRDFACCYSIWVG
jgi:hypothetical protein